MNFLMHYQLNNLSKKKNKWFEKKIKIQNNKKLKLVEKITNIKYLEEKIGIKLSYNQNFIEFSPTTYEYLKIISKKNQ